MVASPLKNPPGLLPPVMLNTSLPLSPLQVVFRVQEEQKTEATLLTRNDPEGGGMSHSPPGGRIEPKQPHHYSLV